MKARLVKTSFWTNPEVELLAPESRYLLLYCITNPYIGLTGAYRLRSERIAYETGYPMDTLSKCFSELEKAHFLVRKDGWIIVFNTDKHNNYSGGSKTGVAYKQEAKQLPEWVLDTLCIPYAYPRHTPIKQKTEIETEIEIENIKQKTETEIESTPTQNSDENAAYTKAREVADSLRGVLQ